MPRRKHPPGEARPKAIRQFTDREEFVDAFEKAISELPLEEYKVLVHYGVGGIGKTELRKELGKLLDKEHPRVAWAVLDFETPTHWDVEGALSWLSKVEMTRKYKVRFRSFELALFQYWQKSRPHTPLRRDHLPLLEEGQILAELIYLGAYLPGVAIAAKGTLLVGAARQRLEEWWTKRGQRQLYELQEMAPNDIAERLPMFWATDLKDFMQRESRPVVLFVDSYEALWGKERTEGSFFIRDKWVRELVAQLPKVLWVIAGRQKLRWEEEDRDWGSCLEQHLVGQLAENDSRTFLSSCKVTEEAIQQAIVEGSKGVPSYLDLAVDSYEEIKKGQHRDPVPADFEGTPQKVFNRFLRYLDQAEEETLRVLSVPRFWDGELFKLLIEEFKTYYPVTALDKLCRFSFIQELQVSGTWTIHPLMRESLQERLPVGLRERVHQYLFDHYNRQLQGLESTAISDPHKTALTEAFHHGKHTLAPEELFEWFTTIEEIFDHAALWQFLIPLYEEFARLIEDRLGPEHPHTTKSLNNLAVLYRQQGRYGEAEPLYERTLGIYEKVLGAEHPDTAQRLNNLAELYRQQGRYEGAEPLHERALGIREKILGSEHPDTAQSLNNLALLYNKQGRYEEAEPLYEQALGILEKVLGPEYPHTTKSLNNLAGLYAEQGRYEEAEPLHERVLRIREKILGLEHPDTVSSLNNLAMLYADQGRYEKAKPIFEQALAINEKVLGPEHPDTALSLNNLAFLYDVQGRYEEAESLYERALGIREKILGPEHPGTATGLNNLAELYRQQGRYEGAEPLYKRALGIKEKVLGLEHSDTTISLNNLALLYTEQGRYEEAESPCKRALGIWEKALGPEHPYTALSLGNLALLYAEQGRYEEAEPLFERALEIHEKVLGPEHPYTAMSLYYLAKLYHRKGQYRDAEPIYRRALRIQEKKLGCDHPDTVQTREALEDVQQKRRESSGESDT